MSVERGVGSNQYQTRWERPVADVPSERAGRFTARPSLIKVRGREYPVAVQGSVGTVAFPAKSGDVEVTYVLAKGSSDDSAVYSFAGLNAGTPDESDRQTEWARENDGLIRDAAAVVADLLVESEGDEGRAAMDALADALEGCGDTVASADIRSL